MKLRLIFILAIVTPLYVNGQYFQYTQYNFTDQRINPALVASSDYASAAFVFRNQRTGGGDIRLRSSIVAAALPLLGGKYGRRWSGVGVSLMDDRSGGIFTVQEASLSYAINVFLNRLQFLSLGFKALYQQRSVNLNGLYTGMQYIRDRGFDESLFNGETLGLLRSDFATFSSGLYWQQNDRQGRKIAYLGLSFFDMNRPPDSFTGVESQLHSTLVASAGARVYQERNFSLIPEVLWTRSAGRDVVNAGMVTSYEVRPYPNQVAGRVDLITKYIAGRSGVAGLQFHRDHYSVGFSYEFPVVTANSANIGAFEVGLQIRRLVRAEARRRAARRRSAGSVSKPVTAVKAEPATDPAGSVAPNDVAKTPVSTQGDLKASLRVKADSVMARAKAGKLSHEPFVIEKLTLHFNFEFNSSKLDAASLRYLDDLSEALKENAHMKIKLTGHTDNIGSAAFNMRLSVFRAGVIKEYLIARGIEPARIQAEGKGMSEPLNGNQTQEDRARNRRVELLIFYQE